MREMFERMMHAMGWMPIERERVLEDALAEVERELIRVTASWEKAEARIRELEHERDVTAALFGGRSMMVRAVANRDRLKALVDKLQELNERADWFAKQ